MSKHLIDAINHDIKMELEREHEHLFEGPDSERLSIQKGFYLGMNSMNPAIELLITAAEKGGFAQWISTKPDVLKRLYDRNVPRADEIIAEAKKTQFNALIALDNWDAYRK